MEEKKTDRTFDGMSTKLRSSQAREGAEPMC
jgi:hypothetical protein